MITEPFIGAVGIFAGNFAVRGWAMCNGQLISIPQNEALFSIIGTIYGGDGRTTFALPDLRGRRPIGMGTGAGLNNYREGQRGGQEYVTLMANEMPSHSHNINIAPGTATSDKADGLYLAHQVRGGADVPAIYSSAAPTGAVLNSASVANNGGSQAHSNREPFLAINYQIALLGMYPPRD